MTSEELNQACITRLSSADLAGRVAIIGSGLSSPHIPSIAELERRFCIRCRITKDPHDQFFWNLAQRAFENDSDEYYKVIKEAYGDTLPWTADAYDLMVRVRFLGLATLNYDSQLLKAVIRRDSNALFAVYPPRQGHRFFNPMEFSSARQRLIAIHGYCDPENPEWEREIILKASDYDRHYIGSTALLHHWWTSLLLAIPCIFIGTTLQEPGLLSVVKSLLTEQRDRLLSRNHLHLVCVKENFSAHDPPGTTLGVIEQVPYDPLDGYHKGLIRVLAAASGISLELPSPGMPTPGLIMATGSISQDDFASFS